MPLKPPSSPYTLSSLQQVMADLRDPVDGCPWDREQNFSTIAPFTIEEAYEVADAIARGNMDELRSELGDLLLQIVYHSQMANEAGAFALGDVINAICDKMIRRHAHIYGDATTPDATAQSDNWEAVKAVERKGAGQAGILDGVAIGLPALLRAQKIQKRAARVGFDWPDASGPRAKIDEELAECAAAATPADLHDEIGDLLFSVVNWSRHQEIDAEAALRDATARFERRFAHVEINASAPLDSLDIAALEALWRDAKARERPAQ